MKSTEQTVHTAFPERVRDLRHKHGLSQAQLARETGVHPDSIMLWETGRCRPREQKLKLLADYFGVSTDYLRGETDDPQTSLHPLHPLLNDVSYSTDYVNGRERGDSGRRGDSGSQLMWLFADLSEESQEKAMEYMQALYDEDGRKGTLASQRLLRGLGL